MRAVVIRFYHFSHLTAVSKILVILHSTVLPVLHKNILLIQSMQHNSSLHSVTLDYFTSFSPFINALKISRMFVTNMP